jgi:hypothetical protein
VASKLVLSVSKRIVIRRLLKQTLAIVGGNLLYFFALMPHVPEAGRHLPDRLDLGLVVDFWVCVAVYGVIEMVDRKRKRA